MGKVTIIIESNDGEPDGNTNALYKALQELCPSEDEVREKSGVKDAKIYIVPSYDSD